MHLRVGTSCAYRLIAQKPSAAAGKIPAAAPEIAEGSVAEQRRRIIPVSAVREQRDDHFSFVLRPFRELDRAVKRRTGRDSYGDALFMGKELSRLKSSLIGSLEDLIIFPSVSFQISGPVVAL